MTELTIQFNYVQDCVVLLREDFLKYTCVILPKEITRGHADNLIKRCRHTVLEDERIRPLLFDLLENIATTKLPNGRYEYCDGGWGICKGDAMFVLTTVNDEGNIVIRSPYFQKFLLSFAYKNDVPVNLAAYQKCIDELNAVSPYNKSFS